ncbi:MAG: sigma-70 family RNA polymerase sigma factor [Myxococcales bacterium]|nr:sigma-70 family RNA polymerase sigma factor [Myxococcales bacterium]
MRPGGPIHLEPSQLVAEHGPAIWSVCRRLCDEPEDAYQEIWAKALGAIHRFDPEGRATLRTWLLTVAHHHLIDRHRRRRTRGVVVELPDLPVAPTTEANLDAARRRVALERALCRLPDDQRRAVVLHHLHGQPLDLVASTEGVAIGTVKSRLHRGRARLAALLHAWSQPIVAEVPDAVQR